MTPKIFREAITLEDGRTLTLETGKLARQADGAVVVQLAGTMLLATVVSATKANEGVDFLPLTVDYREKYASAGRFPGGFFKREGRPSTEEILTMRLVDRVLRPRFPKDYHNETQVMIQLLSYDPTAQPEALAGLAASTALALSDIPFDGPISELRIVRKNGAYQINPGLEDLQEVDIDMMVGASQESVVMVEGEMEEIPEGDMLEAIQHAHQAIREQIQLQLRLVEKVGKKPVRDYQGDPTDEALAKQIADFSYDQCYAIAKENLPKHERAERFEAIVESFKETLSESAVEEKAFLIGKYFQDTKKRAVRDLILDEKKRLDGRSPQDIRPIWCETDLLPQAHGSALFTRGETQSLTTVTLGNSLDANRIDGIAIRDDQRFYLHYNFPPFSTGEARPIRGTSRREIGHGNLAQRALQPMIPTGSPYTIRVVSDILESNGSSSMATVCAGTMALMDAGVHLKKHVSGIAMGLITDPESGRWAVLSDILGDEDHLGDMDFKVTGTKAGITACQMDIKIKGLTYEIMEKALEQAKAGRLHILEKLLETIPTPRADYKEVVPKMERMEIEAEFIGAVIGPGGKTIQSIQADTETNIALEEVDGKGVIEISGFDRDHIQSAKNTINEIAFKPVVGEVYQGTVKTIMPYGAFVSIGRKVEGLLHVSELDWKRVENVESLLKEGDKIEVKLIEIDQRRGGKLRLSRKALLPRPEHVEGA